MITGAKSCGVVAAVLLASCGGERSPDFYIHGTGVIVDSRVPFVRNEDFARRIETTVDAALAYWGGSWRNLEGRTITLEDAQYVTCDTPNAIGCNDGDIRMSVQDPSFGPWQCVEQTVLVHEVGHSVVGDPMHSDPRWMDFGPVLATLSGRTGYGEVGEVPCVLFPSVWRHVLSYR